MILPFKNCSHQLVQSRNRTMLTFERYGDNSLAFDSVMEQNAGSLKPLPIPPCKCVCHSAAVRRRRADTDTYTLMLIVYCRHSIQRTL